MIQLSVDGKKFPFTTTIFPDGTKKSAKGLLRVNEDMTLSQEVTPEEEQTGLLETVFLDGSLVKETSLAEVRNLLNK
jgi:nicotinamide phosphoribosyltransferase